MVEPISSQQLTLGDLPPASEGWSEAAVRFAHTFDGYAHVGGEPSDLWHRIAGPAMDLLEQSGELPADYTVDDLRACIFYIARSDHFSPGEQAPRELHLYFAALDAIRRTLHRGGSPTNLAAPDPGPPSPAQRAGDPGVAHAPLRISGVTSLGNFSFRWPVGTEPFDHGWDYTVAMDGTEYRLRHGIGGRDVYGQYREHSVTWIGGSPMVEGVAPDDYATSGSLISVIRIGGGPHVRSLDELPIGYAGFEIVRQKDEINAKYARRSLSVKILEDDLEGWARHAILRARSKQAAKTGSVAQSATTAAVVPLTEPPSLDRRSIIHALLEFGRAQAAQQARTGPVEFTPNPEANRLIVENPFAFLLAVIFDQGIIAERAWAAPYELRRRLGHLDLARIVAEPESIAVAVARPPMLQRFINTVPGWVVDAARRVLDEYGGNAGRIWGDEPTAAELEQRFDAFQGIGQKKAAMAVEILERDLGVKIHALHGTNIAYDVHVRRVFLRTGLAAHDDADEMIAAARALHPDRPGEIDFPMWLIGRQWCRPGVPLCPQCPLFAVCPRIVEAAANVRGA